MIYVGTSGGGTLNITAGGIVSNGSPYGYGYIGYDPDSTGAVTVNGDGSTWDNVNSLRIGSSGSGTLNITGGGVVRSNKSSYMSENTDYIGYSHGATGVVTVDGPGSTWTNGGSIRVGESGTGTVNITGGGTVSCTKSTYGPSIGCLSGSMGMVTVEGAGSTLTSESGVLIGVDGCGTLNIRSGGAVRNNVSAYLGYGTGSTGAATVDGADSSWTSSGSMEVGLTGSGTLDIIGGGTVNNSYGFIGDNPGSSGVARVDGSNSTWTNSGDLFVGKGGHGTLTISGGGTVNNNRGSIGAVPGATGVVTVTGSGLDVEQQLGHL